MLSKVRITILLFFIILLFSSFLSPAYAACDTTTEMAKPVADRSPDCPAGLDQFEQVVGNIVSAIVGLGFVAMLFLLIRAGIRYLTSGGDPKTIASAHQAITWALLGILFMAIAWIILLLVEKLTGIDVTNFNLNVLPKGL